MIENIENPAQNLKNNQVKSSYGGKRIKAGRKKGKSKTTELKEKIRDYLSAEEVKDLIETAKTKAKSDSKILIFLLEQIYGKAPQAINLGGDAKIWVIPSAMAKEYGIDITTRGDSKE